MNNLFMTNRELSDAEIEALEQDIKSEFNGPPKANFIWILIVIPLAFFLFAAIE